MCSYSWKYNGHRSKIEKGTKRKKQTFRGKIEIVEAERSGV